ncbi:antifreeze protein Maxi-like [Scaptodrosophila lebanonensis]|uniref:Antifreeze protein Maxi-like n=1 Tax=Drosophila lebanonensis TaxID=7225 RepID=A0A6J2UEJ2_DROLE|nr:antifreeze protein Maxi-like [Scaptodrosophila lebanonensis]
MAYDHLHARDSNRGGGKATRERSKTRKSGDRRLNTASPADCEAEDVSPTKKRIKEKAGVAASSSSSPDLDDGATAAVAKSTASLAADIAAGTNAEGVFGKPATDAAAAAAKPATIAGAADAKLAVDAAVAKPTTEAVFKKPLAVTTVARSYATVAERALPTAGAVLPPCAAASAAQHAVAKSTASLAADIAAGTNAEGVFGKPATDAAAAAAKPATIAGAADAKLAVDAAVAKPTTEAVFKKPLAVTTVARSYATVAERALPTAGAVLPPCAAASAAQQ